MRRIILIVAIFILSVSPVCAISSDLRDNYAPRETLIGHLEGNILSPISEGQVDLVRNGHIPVGFEYGLENLDGEYYIWLIAPQNEGNYTLIIEEVVATEGGYPQVNDYNKEFSVLGAQIPYSVKPGIISASSDFALTVTSYENSNIVASVDFPEVRDIMLKPGINKIDFSISEVVGTWQGRIGVGLYSLPAQIFGVGHVCGDEEIDGAEVCDGGNLNGNTCFNISSDYGAGSLECSSDCLSFDSSDCADVLACSSNHLELCGDEDECGGIDRYWYGGECNYYSEDAECGIDYPGLCMNEKDCVAIDRYWYGGACNAYREGVGNVFPEFEFRPERIVSTVLISEDVPIYPFEIFNFGKERIEGLVLEYDRDLFVISPDGSISIGVNESVEFNLALRNLTDKQTKGVIFARVGGASKYLLFSVGFTREVDEVSTDYVKGDSEDSKYYCSEIPGSSGMSCGPSEICSGSVVSSIDVTSCCVGSCEKMTSGEGSKAWIGYLLVAIVIAVGSIVYLKYKKTVPTKNPMTKSVNAIEKKLP